MKKFLIFILISVVFTFNFNIPVFCETTEEAVEELLDLLKQAQSTESQVKMVHNKLLNGYYNELANDITKAIDLFYVIQFRNVNLHIVDNKNQIGEEVKTIIRNEKQELNNLVARALVLGLFLRVQANIYLNYQIKALYDYEEGFAQDNIGLIKTADILKSLLSEKQYDYTDRIITIILNSEHVNKNVKEEALTAKNVISENISSIPIDKINIPTEISSQNTIISSFNDYSMQKEYDLIKQLPYAEYQNFYNSIKNYSPDKQYKLKKQWWNDIKSEKLLSTAEAEWIDYYKNYEINKKNGIVNWQNYYSSHSLDLTNPIELKTTEAISIVLFDKEKYYHNDFYEWAEKVVDNITTYYDKDEIRNRQKWIYTILSKPIDIVQLTLKEYTNYVNLLNVSLKAVDTKYIDVLITIASNKKFNINEFIRIYQLYGYYNLPLVNKYYDSIKELYPVMCTNEEFESDLLNNYTFTVYTEKRLALYDYLRKTLNFSVENSRQIVEYPNITIADKSEIVKKIEKNNNLTVSQKFEKIIKKLKSKESKNNTSKKNSLFSIITFPIKIVFKVLGKILLGNNWLIICSDYIITLTFNSNYSNHSLITQG